MMCRHFGGCLGCFGLMVHRSSVTLIFCFLLLRFYLLIIELVLMSGSMEMMEMLGETVGW